MNDYQQYLTERERIDFHLQKGFKIISVTENLNGAFVLFEKKEQGTAKKESEWINILTAEGRKYFSVRLIQQQKD